MIGAIMFFFTFFLLSNRADSLSIGFGLRDWLFIMVAINPSWTPPFPKTQGIVTVTTTLTTVHSPGHLRAVVERWGPNSLYRNYPIR